MNAKELMGKFWRPRALGRFGEQCRALCRKLYKDDRGQSTTEYILILAVVVMVALKFKQTFASRLDGIVTKVGNDLDSATNP